MTAQIIRFPRPRPTSPEQLKRMQRALQREASPHLTEEDLDRIDEEMAPLLERARAELSLLLRKE